MQKSFRAVLIVIMCVASMSLQSCGPSESETRLQKQREKILPKDGPAKHPSEWNKDGEDKKSP